MSKELNKAPVEQAGGDERAAFELFVRKHCGMPEHITVNWDAKFTNDAWEGWKARAALAQPSQAIAAAPTYQFQSREIGESDWAPCDFRWYLYCSKSPEMDTRVVEVAAQPSPVQADEKPGDSILCYGCFAKGVGPEHFDEAGKCLVRQQTEPLGAEFAQVLSDNLPELLSTAQAEQAEAELDFSRPLETENGDPVEWIGADVIEYKSARVCVAKDTGLVYSSPYIGLNIRNVMPEQAEAERPEVVGVRYEDGTILSAEDCGTALEVCAKVQTPLMTVAQHERIVEARWNRAMDLMGEHVARISEKLAAERDAALARVAELEKQEPAGAPMPDEIHQMAFEEGQPAEDGDGYLFSAEEFDLFVQRLLDSCAAPVAQAQHSVPETTNKEANSFLRIADAGQFKDNAVAVRTAAVIIRGLLHRPALMQSIIRHRIGLTPEYEGQWHADLYGEDGEVQHHAAADTPDEAVRAVVALVAAPGKEVGHE
ncbi:hypothetical protein [Pseudomonas aeruginosa]|uniref:hypothetical protein n=1 Tax=Pseudomonas aeruginosa TaxID=287 RepID=UPI0018E0173B|nr:hypothetical protein [Pseudomonas aeruginosa]QPZ69387.1 hypothetical protein I9X29_17080 [Pseudomonas aeruginosa]